MKEIAVSDTPKILDKIDEYDNKIQNILKVEQFLNNVSLEEIDKTFHKLRYIKETLSPQILTSNDSEPIFDSSDEPIFEPDGQVMYGPSAFDK